MEALEQAIPPPPQQQTDPGIDLLVTLAKNGEIDPWDIDIVLVTDKYLKALDQLAHRTLEASGKVRVCRSEVHSLYDAPLARAG